jgi:hypothetical protein
LKVRWRLGKARARPETHPPICVWAAHSGAEQNAAAKWGVAAQVQQPDFLPKVSRRGHRHGRHGAHHHRAHHEKLKRRAPNHPQKRALTSVSTLYPSGSLPSGIPFVPSSNHVPRSIYQNCVGLM